MKKFIIFGLFSLLLTNVFSQKDLQAWKGEKNVESQYKVLKNNVSRWNGFIMIKEPQLNEFHKSMVDSIVVLEKKNKVARLDVATAKKDRGSLIEQLANTQAKLDTSLLKQDEFTTLGMAVNKNTFPTVLYSIIIILIVVGLIAFFLFFRSNVVTKKAEKRNEELTEKLKTQKAVSLDRETKLARELQTERNKNYK